MISETPCLNAEAHPHHLPLAVVQLKDVRRLRPQALLQLADDATLDRLEGENLVALRYATKSGDVTPAVNLNGSARSIAGILSPNLRVLGLMPHPEDLVDPLIGGADGKPLFDALAAA